MFVQHYPREMLVPDYYHTMPDKCDSNDDSIYSDSSEFVTPPHSPGLRAEVLFIFYPIVTHIVEEPTVPEPSPILVPDPGTPPCQRRLIKWNLPPPVNPMHDLPGWQPMPYGLQVYWQSAFAWFFGPFAIHSDHLWTLTPVVEPPLDDDWPWHTTNYSAKVRFQCQLRHGWTSMKGRVVFWFRIRRHQDEIRCQAVFKLFGQQCNRCSSPSSAFLFPLWYQEEIENAVRHLSLQVGEVYYGGPKTPQLRRLRQGCPARHHVPDRCQACAEGICVPKVASKE